MPFQLTKSVLRIMKMAEDATGKKIETAEISNLPVSARIEPARPDMPVHRLLISPEADEQINYIIANQCGHILRLYAAPPERRFMPIANRRTMMSFILETENDINRISEYAGKEKIKRLVRLWYEGAVYQLTKMPPDIMIDKWIYDEFPELRPIQLASIRNQRKTAVLSLSEDLKKITPAKVYNASNIMNYAFFKSLEDYFHLDFVAPYHNTVFIYEGSALARLTENEYINSHEGDREMIDKWAQRLDLTKWFEWKHFNNEGEAVSN